MLPGGEPRGQNKGAKSGKEGRTDSQKTKIYYGNFIDNCHCKLTSLPLLLSQSQSLSQSASQSQSLSALRCRGFVGMYFAVHRILK